MGSARAGSQANLLPAEQSAGRDGVALAGHRDRGAEVGVADVVEGALLADGRLIGEGDPQLRRVRIPGLQARVAVGVPPVVAVAGAVHRSPLVAVEALDDDLVVADAVEP